MERLNDAVDVDGDVLPHAQEGVGERADGAVCSEHEATVLGHGGEERLRYGPDEGDGEEAEPRVEAPCRRQRRLGAVGPAGHLEEDEEDEQEQVQLVPRGPPLPSAAASSGGVAVEVLELGRGGRVPIAEEAVVLDQRSGAAARPCSDGGVLDRWSCAVEGRLNPYAPYASGSDLVRSGAKK